MMETISVGTLAAVAGAITAIGGAYLTVRKVQKDHKSERELEAAKVLQDAKEALVLVETKLASEIDSLKLALENLQDNVDKDISHMRETYNGEIRFLGQKIEELRSEVRNQHGQLVGLLTKMIDKK